MVVQKRSKKTLAERLEELPDSYYTETLFAVGIVQAQDLREYSICNLIGLTCLVRGGTVGQEAFRHPRVCNVFYLRDDLRQQG